MLASHVLHLTRTPHQQLASLNGFMHNASRIASSTPAADTAALEAAHIRAEGDMNQSARI
jgi:aspartyl/asparaginyl beta-hydroxylase (cupin superfamily)